jgi:hypothetical protein
MSRAQKNELILFDESDIVLREESNPRSVINLVPPYLQTQIKVIPEEFLDMEEEELKVAGRCDIVENRLKHSFWHEYTNAQLKGRSMNLVNVYSGVCSSHYFKNSIIHNSYKLAYILIPPASYRIALDELLSISLEQIRDIMTTPHRDAKGKVDAKLAAVKVKIADSIIMRVKGAVVQKVEQKNLNVNVDVEDYDEKLRELEAQINKTQGNVIDVEEKATEGKD